MNLPPRDLLSRLGSGESIDFLCSAAGISRDEFSTWWKSEIAARVPPANGTVNTGVKSGVRIERDEKGIPHVIADNDDDLFIGFGYATAQDRLFQLDYLRRRAVGRLSEILGPEGLELDLTSRTVGLPGIAEREWEQLPDETRRLLLRYSDGINALITESRANLPIEFDLLDYQPEPWRPQDSLAIAGEFRWYLTGRFPVICIPELAKRNLGAGPLYRAFLLAEADHEVILPGGAYPSTRGNAQPVGVTISDSAEGTGSNNWVISGARSKSGKPIVASDPHIAFAAVSCWHEVRLRGGSFNVAGMAYAGMPAVMFGRNERVAWGITNNICSLRDLYQEKTDPAHPGCFLFDGKWEPARETAEEIRVKGGETVRKTIRALRNGPIVDEILPPQARGTGPVSLRWLGREYCGWLTALLNMDRAKTVDELRKATEPWMVPTFCVVTGDVDGHIAYQCTGRIPVRNVWERGYRPGWDPAHQWAGLIPFEGMPAWKDPPRGWIATANNRVAADDFPYPLAGTWGNGYRALRIRQMLEAEPKHSRTDFAAMQQDAMSLRAVDCVPRLLAMLRERGEEGVKELKGEKLKGSSSLFHSSTFSPFHLLSTWDCRMTPDSVAATIFNVFFTRWSQTVAEVRFPSETAAFVAPALAGLAAELLAEDGSGWFESPNTPAAPGSRGAEPDARKAAILNAFAATLDWLAAKLGPDPAQWTWGRLHLLQRKHPLSARGDLGKLLDLPDVAVRGDYVTVCNTGQGPNFDAPTGAGYRLIADLAEPLLHAVDAGSESGHPGSPHYDDQIADWQAARYHSLPVRAESGLQAGTCLTLSPR